MYTLFKFMKLPEISVKPGWWITYFLCAVPVLCWSVALPIEVRFVNLSSSMTSIGDICGLVGLTLFSLSVFLAARLQFTEKLFGGLNRIYIAHHLIGGSAFLFLLVHPMFTAGAFLPISAKLALAKIIPSAADWPANFGIIALALLMALLIFTYFINLPYQWWRFTHKFMGLALALGGLHALFIPSDISRVPFLTNYYILLAGSSLILYLYRTVLGRWMVRRYIYTVNGVTNLNKEVVNIELSPTKEAMNFLPGQFMFVSFDHKDFGETHPFSLSSSPTDQHLAFAAKASGDWTNKLSSLPSGTQAKIEGPFGYFTYSRYSNHKQIWVAGGIGITPFYSMARALLPEYDIYLYYALSDESEAVLLNELNTLAKDHSNFHVLPWYSKSQGRISADKIAATHEPITFWDIFVCGPPPMMASLKKQFKMLGLKNSQIHSEEFKID